MNEMLGNQYFLSRNYLQAQIELERALRFNPTNLSIKKKLVICNIQSGSVQRALDLFLETISEDINSIIDTDPIFDNCPCPQLVYEMENSLQQSNTRDKILALGMLWLFCDLKESIKYFTSVENPDETIRKIVTQLQLTVHQLRIMRSE